MRRRRLASRHRATEAAASPGRCPATGRPPPRCARSIPASSKPRCRRSGRCSAIDLSAGYGPLCWDPFEVYEQGLVTNPNVFVMGEPGFSKSSLIKCWAAWQHCLYGPSRWLTITDPKGEYRPLAERIGMTVIRLEPGGGTRINPLESHTRFGTTADLKERTQDRIVQATMLYSLAGTQLERRLDPARAQGAADRRRHPRRPHRGRRPRHCSDVLAPAGDPDRRDVRGDQHAAATQLVRDVEEVRFALDELCTGPLRGMFDGPSNVDVDWNGSGLVMDLTGVVDDERAMALAMVASVSAGPASNAAGSPAVSGSTSERRELLHVPAGRDRRVRPGAPQARPPLRRSQHRHLPPPVGPAAHRPTTARRSPRWPRA